MFFSLLKKRLRGLADFSTLSHENLNQQLVHPRALHQLHRQVVTEVPNHLLRYRNQQRP